MLDLDLQAKRTSTTSGISPPSENNGAFCNSMAFAALALMGWIMESAAYQG
jgi:hypothetical protein